jgi:hypothetical protein
MQMDNSSTNFQDVDQQRLLQHPDIILQLFLIVVLLFAGTVGWIPWSVIGSSLLGMVLAAAGGLSIGAVAYRFLGRGQNNREILTGMIVSVGLGILTIGYLYIVHIKGPMNTIGTPSRTVKQTFIFLEFLLAHVSGIRLGSHYLSVASEDTV